MTSGWVEGLNNKIKVIKRRCYGIPNPVTLSPSLARLERP
ncbi:MAG: transposase [Blastocatellales bacterium]|nr:transposase [Blastocatellales bacterium]